MFMPFALLNVQIHTDQYCMALGWVRERPRGDMADRHSLHYNALQLRVSNRGEARLECRWLNHRLNVKLLCYAMQLRACVHANVIDHSTTSKSKRAALAPLHPADSS